MPTSDQRCGLVVDKALESGLKILGISGCARAIFSQQAGIPILFLDSFVDDARFTAVYRHILL